MTTVREVRVQHARDVIDQRLATQPGVNWCLDSLFVYDLANAVVDLFFPPDPILDNAQVWEGG